MCGNVLLSLNRQGAFKLMSKNLVEHDPAVVKSMHLKLDEMGQQDDFCQKVMTDPQNYLPNKEV